MLITNFFAYYFDKCIVGSTQLNMEVNWPRDWQPRGLREWRGRLGEVLEAHTGLDRGLKDQGNQVTVLGSRPKEGARGRGFLSVLGEFLEHVVEPSGSQARVGEGTLPPVRLWAWAGTSFGLCFLRASPFLRNPHRPHPLLSSLGIETEPAGSQTGGSGKTSSLPPVIARFPAGGPSCAKKECFRRLNHP